MKIPDSHIGVVTSYADNEKLLPADMVFIDQKMVRVRERFHFDIKQFKFGEPPLFFCLAAAQLFVR